MPWALAELTLVARRCCRRGHLAPLGIGVTWTVLRLAVALVFILVGSATYLSSVAGRLLQLRPPGMGTVTFSVFGRVLMTPIRNDVQLLTSHFWDLLTATARGPLRPGVDAPLRRYTDLAMRPFMAAAAWFGLGMW